jgi:hypothetical protein
MGNRRRAGESVAAKKLQSELRANDNRFSRARAERALRNGADPATTYTDDKGAEHGLFTEHQNKHVKALAQKLIAKSAPQAGETEELPVVEDKSDDAT